MDEEGQLRFAVRPVKLAWDGAQVLVSHSQPSMSRWKIDVILVTWHKHSMLWAYGVIEMDIQDSFIY